MQKLSEHESLIEIRYLRQVMNRLLDQLEESFSRSQQNRTIITVPLLGEAPAKKPHRISEEGRQRMIEGQRKRWAKVKRLKKQAAKETARAAVTEHRAKPNTPTVKLKKTPRSRGPVSGRATIPDIRAYAEHNGGVFNSSKFQNENPGVGLNLLGIMTQSGMLKKTAPGMYELAKP